MPFGNFPNASSVGARTVNGPLLFRVSTNPAAFTAATNVVKLPAFTATSTIVGIFFTYPQRGGDMLAKMVNKHLYTQFLFFLTILS